MPSREHLRRDVRARILAELADLDDAPYYLDRALFYFERFRGHGGSTLPLTTPVLAVCLAVALTRHVSMDEDRICALALLAASRLDNENGGEQP